MLCKIRCIPMHSLNDALPGPYVPVRITRGALVAHRYTYLCATSLQNLAVQQNFWSSLSVPLEWSCWPRVRWCPTGGFQEQGQCFFIGLSYSIPTIVFYYFSLSLLPVYRLVLWVWGRRTDRVYTTLSQRCTADLFSFNNNNDNIHMYCTNVLLYICTAPTYGYTYVLHQRIAIHMHCTNVWLYICTAPTYGYTYILLKPMALHVCSTYWYTYMCSSNVCMYFNTSYSFITLSVAKVCSTNVRLYICAAPRYGYHV